MSINGEDFERIAIKLGVHPFWRTLVRCWRVVLFAFACGISVGMLLLYLLSLAE